MKTLLKRLSPKSFNTLVKSNDSRYVVVSLENSLREGRYLINRHVIEAKGVNIRKVRFCRSKGRAHR